MRFAAVTFALLAAGACGRSSPPPALSPAQFRGANILLVTIDTLRRDRLGAYGSAAGLTPTLDRLAASGIVFTHAYSHVPMTLPAHTSIFTGRVPSAHGVHNNTTFRLAADVPTIATMLKGAGYRTGAFVGAFVLDARFGLNRGFDDYDDRYPHSSATTFQSTSAGAAKSSGSRAIGFSTPNQRLEARGWRLEGPPRPRPASSPEPPVPGLPGSISSIRTRRTTRRRSIEPAALPTTPRSRTRTRCSAGCSTAFAPRTRSIAR